jgi:hypothetical protein
MNHGTAQPALERSEELALSPPKGLQRGMPQAELERP